MFVRALALLTLLGSAAMVSAQTLRIGFGTDKPPYVFESEMRGLELEIVIEAARRAGMVVEPFIAPMERLHYMQERQELDGIATTNPRGGLKAHFSKPYIEYQNFAVALAERQLVINSIADLGQHSVSAFQRARKLLGPEFEAMAEKNPGYREEAQQVTRNRLLFAGRVDVIIGDRRIIEHFTGSVSQQIDVRKALTWYDLFPPTPYHVAFRDPAVRTRFDNGLSLLRKSPDYGAIEKRYQRPVK